MMSAMMDDALGSEAEPQLATGDDAASTELQPEEERQSSDDSEDVAEEQEIAEDEHDAELTLGTQALVGQTARGTDERARVDWREGEAGAIGRAAPV